MQACQFTTHPYNSSVLLDEDSCGESDSSHVSSGIGSGSGSNVNLNMYSPYYTQSPPGDNNHNHTTISGESREKAYNRLSPNYYYTKLHLQTPFVQSHSCAEVTSSSGLGLGFTEKFQSQCFQDDKEPSEAVYAYQKYNTNSNSFTHVDSYAPPTEDRTLYYPELLPQTRESDGVSLSRESSDEGILRLEKVNMHNAIGTSYEMDTAGGGCNDFRNTEDVTHHQDTYHSEFDNNSTYVNSYSNSPDELLEDADLSPGKSI
jgi:hypothetical protein